MKWSDPGVGATVTRPMTDRERGFFAEGCPEPDGFLYGATAFIALVGAGIIAGLFVAVLLCLFVDHTVGLVPAAGRIFIVGCTAAGAIAGAVIAVLPSVRRHRFLRRLRLGLVLARVFHVSEAAVIWRYDVDDDESAGDQDEDGDADHPAGYFLSIAPGQLLHVTWWQVRDLGPGGVFPTQQVELVSVPPESHLLCVTPSGPRCPGLRDVLN